MDSAPMNIAPSGSGDLDREVDMVIKPEEQRCNH